MPTSLELQEALHEGEMTVRLGEGPGATRLRVWVDAHRPVVRVEADCGEPSELEATLEVWRAGEREVPWKGGRDVGRFAVQPIRLRFLLKDADLYAIRFAGQ